MIIQTLALALALQAAEPQWRLAALGGEAPTRSAFFVDAASVERRGDRVRFWTQTIMEQPLEQGTFDRSVILREGSCSAMSSAMLRRTFYVNGAVLERDDEPGEQTVHARESMMGGVMETVCGEIGYASPPVPDPEGAARAAFRETR